jgi:hypothetical protein
MVDGKPATQARRHEPPPVGSALRRIVANPDAFAAEAWGRRPHRDHHCEGFRDLLSVEAIDRLLESARRPGFRVVSGGRTLAPSEYTKTVRMGGTSLDDAASPARIADLFDAGATLVMQGLERTHEPLRVFTRQLATELSHSVQANAYLSPGGGAKGLGRHADEHDVFVLQVEGDKRWDVEGLGELTMTAGDVLYMPRATQHVAHTDGAPSLHITIGVATATYRDVLRRAVERAAVDCERPTLDQRLPLGFARLESGATGLSDGIAAAISELVDHFQHVKPDEIVDEEQGRVERRLAPRRSLRPAFDAAELTLATPVRTVESRPMSLSTDPDQLVIDLDDRRIRMPLSAQAAVQQLVESGVTTPGDLPDLSNESRLVVVRRLIREGAVMVDRRD